MGNSLSDNSKLQELKLKYEEEYKQTQNEELQRRRTSNKYEAAELFYLQDSGYTNESLEELISSYFPVAKYEDAYNPIKGPRLQVYLPEKYIELFEIWRFAMGFDTLGLYGYTTILLKSDAGKLNQHISELVMKADKLYHAELVESRTDEFFEKYNLKK